MYLLLITVGMYCGACQAAAFTIVGVSLRMDEGRPYTAKMIKCSSARMNRSLVTDSGQRGQ